MILTIGVLKKIIKNIPDDFTIDFSDDTCSIPIDDKIIIDASGKHVILQS